MPNAPTDIPVNGDGTYDEPTWGELGGPFSVPGIEGTGQIAGTALESNTLNYEWQHPARWIRAYAITRSVPSDQGLYGSFLFPNSGGWNVSGGTLNGTLGSSWILVDADDDGGVVIQFNVPAGSPHVFTASRDTYVDLAEDGTATYTAVANGAPEPAVAASSVRVWKVVTDGTEITSANTVLPEIPVFKDIAANSLALTDLLAVGGDLDVTGNLTVHGDTALGDDAGDSVTVTGAVDITGDTAIEGNTSVDGTFTVADNNAASFTGAVTLGSDSADAITVNGTTTFNAPVTIANGQAFTANGNSTIGNADTDTLTCNATATFVNGVSFNGNVTLGDQTTDTITFTAKSASDFDMGTFALRGVGRVVLETGVSPLNAGHLTAGASGLLRYQPAGTAHYVHTSEKGYIQEWSSPASGTETMGAGTELAACTINPVVTGKVLVTATGSLTFATDTSVVLVTLYDTTSNTAVATQNERAPDIDAGGNRTRSFVIRGERTLPDTAARTFVVTLGAADDVDYENLITSAVGTKA
jgi:hypothetical protein